LYLSDKDIRALLPELDVRTDHQDHPFDPNGQIQPCSLDLRLSNVFWMRRRVHYLRRLLRRGPTVDLRQSHIQEIDPRREWRKAELSDGESVTIRPGQVVMTRIYERFRVPDKYAGKIEGRSSYARIGLAIHCTGDFINPGWHGYMPLQLYNASPFPIKILPYLPICQLMLIPISSEPESTYGDERLASKYVNDDGGPSYWWRDRSVKTLHTKLGKANVPIGIQNEVVDLVKFEDAEMLGRFESFVGGKRTGQVDNADTILEEFSVREGRRKWLDRSAGFPFLIAVALSVGLLTIPYEPWHLLVWIGTAFLGLGAIYAVEHRDGDYLDSRALGALRAKNRQRQA
jgi:deoxycytidine triphosphate deaminase